MIMDATKYQFGYDFINKFTPNDLLPDQLFNEFEIEEFGNAYNPDDGFKLTDNNKKLIPAIQKRQREYILDNYLRENGLDVPDRIQDGFYEDIKPYISGYDLKQSSLTPNIPEKDFIGLGQVLLKKYVGYNETELFPTPTSETITPQQLTTEVIQGTVENKNISNITNGNKMNQFKLLALEAQLKALQEQDVIDELRNNPLVIQDLIDHRNQNPNLAKNANAFLLGYMKENFNNDAVSALRSNIRSAYSGLDGTQGKATYDEMFSALDGALTDDQKAKSTKLIEEVFESKDASNAGLSGGIDPTYELEQSQDMIFDNKKYSVVQMMGGYALTDGEGSRIAGIYQTPDDAVNAFSEFKKQTIRNKSQELAKQVVATSSPSGIDPTYEFDGNEFKIRQREGGGWGFQEVNSGKFTGGVYESPELAAGAYKEAMRKPPEVNSSEANPALIERIKTDMTSAPWLNAGIGAGSIALSQMQGNGLVGTGVNLAGALGGSMAGEQYLGKSIGSPIARIGGGLAGHTIANILMGLFRNPQEQQLLNQGMQYSQQQNGGMG
jgi:hypothetical protein